MASNATDPLICEVGGSGLLLPLGGDGEQQWDRGMRTILYLVGLLWCFVGVSIIADVFMAAIETVTSKKKQVQVGDKKVTVKVWNDTVANLTLMALGSSAPEILLSVIELLSASMYSGQLGPSTIVGSAAFNLLVIIAVCVVVIPDGETRQVNQTSVFAVTGSCSMFAYAWLVVILMASSPDVIEVWEGVLTFAFFPVLVIIAYLADIGAFSKKDNGPAKQPQRQTVVAIKGSGDAMSDRELAKVKETIEKERGHRMSITEVKEMMAKNNLDTKVETKTVSMAQRRIDAIRMMSGGPRINQASESAEGKAIEISFNSNKYEGRTDSDDAVVLIVERTGDIIPEVSVQYRTVEGQGTAVAGTEYQATSGVVFIGKGQTEAEVKIPLVKSSAPKIADCGVLVELHDPRSKSSQSVGLGKIHNCAIDLVAHKSAGTLRFSKSEIRVPSPTENVTVEILVVRESGTVGEVSCKYKTEKVTAMPEFDYIEKEGTLTFRHGQADATILVEVVEKSAFEKEDCFRVICEEAEGGATFHSESDGGTDCNIVTVTILSRAETGVANGILRWFDSVVNLDEVMLGNDNWKDQFKSAIYVNGSPEAQAESSGGDIVCHLIALPWKLIFAFVPPTTYFGGWFCFVIAISFIGGVTAIIGDMAALFGCCAGISNSITAITFVALGTSLPDTFASKSAATADPYADACIGNVTGSNSVNVFLGLGLPWMIGAIFWSGEGPTDEWKLKYASTDLLSRYPDGGFVVQSGDLGFSVTVFLICAAICLGTLVLRRRMFGGELGGPTGIKKASAGLFVLLWFYYVALSAWKTTAGEVSGGQQMGAIFTGLAVLLLVGILAKLTGAAIESMQGNSDEKTKADTERQEWQQVVKDLNNHIKEQQKHLAQWQQIASAIHHGAGGVPPAGVNGSQQADLASPPPPSDVEAPPHKHPHAKHPPHAKAKPKAKAAEDSV